MQQKNKSKYEKLLLIEKALFDFMAFVGFVLGNCKCWSQDIKINGSFSLLDNIQVVDVGMNKHIHTHKIT